MRIWETLKKWYRFFCDSIICKANVKRDIIIISVAIFISAILILNIQLSLTNTIIQAWKGAVFGIQAEKEEALFLTEEQIYEEVKLIQNTIDTSNWKTYKSNWYGFEVKYPEDWIVPVNKAALRDSNWEYRYQFRKNNQDQDSIFSGFDMVVYNLSKANGVALTDEFPKIKSEELREDKKCEAIVGHIIETGDYMAEEIYIPPLDDCYNEVLFFSFTKGQYVYNLVANIKEDLVTMGDPRIEISDNFPEFYSVAASLAAIDIVRPKPKPVPPKITAPYPVSYKKKNGRLVCAKKNDKPRKSKKNKGKHLDRECCLDPDEYPNPHCYYPPKEDDD